MKKGYWILFLLAAGFLLNFIIPPFQNPDEPQHFAAVMIHARGEEQQAAVEAEVIRLMDRYNWWKHLGMGKPVALPEALADIPFLVGGYPVKDFRVMLRNIVLYHFLLGKALAFSYNGGIETAYFICRLVSFFCVLGAIILAFISLRKIEERIRIKGGGSPRTFLIPAFLFILFLPQFLQAAVSVNSDALAILLGSLFFYSAVSLMAGERKPVFFVLLVAAAVLGFFSDRSAFPLIPLAAAVPFFIIKKERYKESIVSILAFLTAAFMVAGIVVNLFPSAFENSVILFGNNLQNVGNALPRLFAFDEFSLRFFTASMDSFFLKFGWAVFGPGGGVYIFWRLVVMLSLAGVAAFLVMRVIDFFKSWPEWMERAKKALGIKTSLKRRRRLKAGPAGLWPETKGDEASSGGGTHEKVSPFVGRTEEGASGADSREVNDGFQVKLALFFLLAVFFQLAAAWTYYGSHKILAQGRHFFPLIIPVAFLFVMGIKCFFDLFHPRAGQIALAAFVVLEFFFLNTIVWAQMLPFFHMLIKSPHPGI